MRRLAMLAFLPLAACSFTADMKSTDAAVNAFHRSLNAGQFAQVWDQSAPELKQATTADKFRQILDAVHRKLGSFQKGEQQGWNDNVSPAGHVIVLGYHATYQRGVADEQFVYKIDGNGQAKLAGYHVSSDVLILN